MTAAFSPQDYSRFLIREFLKKNGFDQTYESFMAEDTRPKVTMTKNQLTALLGIESLMKKNSKTKLFSTMLDIVCNHLMETKSDHPETSPQQDPPAKKARPQRPEDTKPHQREAELAKPAAQDPWTENDNTSPITAQFYGASGGAERPKTGVRPNYKAKQQ
jgi:hypothetical protein